MRFLLLAFGLLLPQFGWAQLFSGGFEHGSYVLQDNHTVRYQAPLRLQDSDILMVRDTNGRTFGLTPSQVYSFQLGNRKYVAAGEFQLKSLLGNTTVYQAFVEQIDSGQVILTRYIYYVNAPMSMSPGGNMTPGGGRRIFTTYVLCRDSYWSGITAAQTGTSSSGGKKFREAVRPYLASRPDLAKLLDEKRINAYNLPTAIHALNNNLPFTPPAARDMD